MQLRRHLVTENQDPMIRLEEAVDVLKSAVRRLWVEEVSGWDEGEAYYSSYDPEFPVEVFDADGCYLCGIITTLFVGAVLGGR
jgi:hypothetical protein